MNTATKNIFFGVCVFLSTNVYSIDQLDLGTLTELNFEDLSKVKVSAATKQDLKSSDTPGFVTIYTAREIKALGYYTLAELANITPGFSSMYKFVGKQSFTVRGQRVPGNNFDNNKVLVLVDGIPMNHLRNGRAPMNEELSLDGVDVVEFLKGPASALYGTGAFFGVINITTKHKTREGVSLGGRTTIGSYGTSQNSISSFFKNESISGKAIATYSKRDSMALPWGDRTEGYDRSVDYVNALNLNSSLTLREGALKNLTFGILHNGIKSGTWDNAADVSNGTEADTGFYNFVTRTLYLRYTKKLSDDLDLNSYIRRGWSTEESRSYNYRQNFSNYELLVEARKTLVENKSALIYGINYDQRRRDGRKYGTYQNAGVPAQDDYVKSPSNPLRTYSGYIQYNDRHPVGYGLLSTIGIRYDRSISHEGPMNIDVSQISPRIGLVQKLSDSFSLKFLYGRALRSPDLKAIGVANEATNLFPNSELPGRFTLLDAEKISSYELGVTYEKDKISSTLASFYTVTEDQIGRENVDITPSDPNDELQNLYRNKNGASIGYGLEYEFRYTFSLRSVLNFNASWNFAHLPDNSVDGKGNFGAVPVYMGALYYMRNWDNWSGSIIGTLIGQRRTNHNSEDPQSTKFVLDLNATYTFNPNVDFALWMRNLTNKDYQYSASGAQDKLSERAPGRSFFGSINIRF